MTTIDTRLVDGELRAMIKTSQGVKKRLKEILEAIERNPTGFPLIEDIPRSITSLGNLVGIRKAKVISGKHDFRLLFAHWRFEKGKEHVDLLLAFPREHGYQINWSWVEDHLASR